MKGLIRGAGKGTDVVCLTFIHSVILCTFSAARDDFALAAEHISARWPGYRHLMFRRRPFSRLHRFSLPVSLPSNHSMGESPRRAAAVRQRLPVIYVFSSHRLNVNSLFSPTNGYCLRMVIKHRPVTTKLDKELSSSD